MKKKIIIVIIIVLVAMLFPVVYHLNDGGTVEYKAILYTISDVKSIADDKKWEQGYSYYNEGIVIEIFGFVVYDNTKLVTYKDGNKVKKTK